MKMKSVVTALVAAAFLLSLVSPSLAAGYEKMGVSGKVTKIEGNKVTVQDDTGKETTVEVKDATGAKVGGKVKIENGVIEHEPRMYENPKLQDYEVK